MAVALPLSMCKKGGGDSGGGDSEVVITTQAEAREYLSKHETVHNYPGGYTCTKTEDEILLGWFWDINNYGTQNLANGFVSFYLQYLESYVKSVTIKWVHNDSTEISAMNGEGVETLNEFKFSQQMKEWICSISSETSNLTYHYDGKSFDHFDGLNHNYIMVKATDHYDPNISETFSMYWYSKDYPNINFTW